MKKSICVLLTVMMCLSMTAGCDKVGAASDNRPEPDNVESNGPITNNAEPNTPKAPNNSEPSSKPDKTSQNLELEYNKADGKVVYFTSDISSDGMVAIYQALDVEPMGEIAVKLSTGEPPNSNYLKPELIKDLVQSLNGTIVECNTAYGGMRDATKYHLQVAKNHGFTDIAEFDLMDSEEEISIPVVGGEVLKENIVGSHFTNYDYFVVLSHFKGHAMAGFGGAIKNISIGIASRSGKLMIHSGGKENSGVLTWGYDQYQDKFLMSMAEAGKSVSDSLNSNILYINVMNSLSIDCDCNGSPSKPDMHDVGILASFDPVALDQACVDIVSASSDGKSLMDRINVRNGLLTLEHAAKIGLGSREYTLVSIDD